MKRRLSRVPPAALAAVLSLGPTPLWAQYASAPAVVPAPASAGAASPAAASARVRLAPAPGSVSPAALTLSLFSSAIPAPQPQAAAVVARPVAVSAVLAAPASAAKAAEFRLLIAEAKSENIKWNRLGRVIQSMERLAQVAPYYLEPADVQALQTAQAEAWARWREAGEGLFGSSLSGTEKALGGSSTPDMTSSAAMVVKAAEASEAAAEGGKVRLLSAREDQIRVGDKVVFNSNGYRYAVTVKKLYADGTALVSHGWFPDFKDQYLPVSILVKEVSRVGDVRVGDKVVFNSNGYRYAVTVKKLSADGTALVSHGWFPDFKDQYLPVSILTKQSSSKPR